MNKKATLATVKAFMAKNTSRLYVKATSSFDGMVDCVMPIDGACFRPVFNTFRRPTKEDLGCVPAATCNVPGVWFVRGSRDYITPYASEGFTGFRVSNCCGSFIVAVKD